MGLYHCHLLVKIVYLQQCSSIYIYIYICIKYNCIIFHNWVFYLSAVSMYHYCIDQIPLHTLEEKSVCCIYAVNLCHCICYFVIFGFIDGDCCPSSFVHFPPRTSTQCICNMTSLASALSSVWFCHAVHLANYHPGHRQQSMSAHSDDHPCLINKEIFAKEPPKLMFLLHMLSCDQTVLEYGKWGVAHFDVCMFSTISPCILVIWSVTLFYRFSWNYDCII